MVAYSTKYPKKVYQLNQYAATYHVVIIIVIIIIVIIIIVVIIITITIIIITITAVFFSHLAE